MRIRYSRLIAVLLILLAIAGCSVHPGVQPSPAVTAAQPSMATSAAKAQADEISALLQTRAQAVNGGDQQAYLSTVLPSDTVLLKEESNLIRAAAGLNVQDYKAVASKPVQVEGGYTAKVTQSYTVAGEKRKCSYDALFVEESGKLYYDGPAFLYKQSDRVKVGYIGAAASGLAQNIFDAETAVLDDMASQLAFVPKGAITVKIYANQPVFQQSIKLDLPGWVGGWQEYGEAIKSFAGAYPTETGDLRRMLNHESTHRMVSELSNDNASYWIQEGLASVFQDVLGNSGSPYLTAQEAGESYTPYATQKSIDLEKIGTDDGASVTKYYATSKAYAAFLLDRYGWEKMRQALEYMQKYPLIPVTGAEKITETNERTDDAIRTVFGFATDEDFQKAFDEWLKKQE